VVLTPPGDTPDIVGTFLRTRFRSSIRGELGADHPLFSSGIVDSFGVLELIAFLEDTFHVVIDPSRHELNEFDTINKIVLLVERLAAQRSN
jgi:acyl carrier protein